MDLAIANFSSGNSISVLIGNGLGSFSAASSFAVGGIPTSVSSADFNEDGKMDLVITNDAPANTVSVLIGNGLGSFSVATNFAVGTNPYGGNQWSQPGYGNTNAYNHNTLNGFGYSTPYSQTGNNGFGQIINIINNFFGKRPLNSLGFQPTYTNTTTAPQIQYPGATNTGFMGW
jgi:hypothetical protein